MVLLQAIANFLFITKVAPKCPSWLSVLVSSSGGGANLQGQRNVELEWGQSGIISPSIGYDGMTTVSVSTKKPSG